MHHSVSSRKSILLVIAVVCAALPLIAEKPQETNRPKYDLSTASAITPIRPTLPPPYTNPMLLRTNSAAISSAATRYSGRLPELEPQKTQIRFMQTF